MMGAGYTTDPPEVAEAMAVYRCFQTLNSRPQRHTQSSYREGWQDGVNDLLETLTEAAASVHGVTG